jgi:hypothetical protein
MKTGLIRGEELIQCVIDHIEHENEEFTLPVVFSTVQWVLKYKIDAS